MYRSSKHTNHEDWLKKKQKVLTAPCQETEFIIKSLSIKKTPEGFTSKFYQRFEEETIQALHKCFKKKKKSRRNTSQITGGPTLPWYWNQTEISQKKNIISLMNIFINILNKIVANWIYQYIKRIIHHDQLWFVPGMQGCLTFKN